MTDLLSRPVRAPVRRRRRRTRPKRRKLLVAIAWPGALAIVAIVIVNTRPTTTPNPECAITSTVSNAAYKFRPDQAQNASIIAAVASTKKLPDHAVTVALAAALQESGLRNLPYGDLDSVGLFQERPSQGWGTTEQILQPAYAAGAFYDRLARVPGWESMPVTQAAQAVEQSAAPNAYANWEGEARAMAIAFTGQAAAGLSCQFGRFGGSPPAPTALANALESEMGSDLLGVPVSTTTGWRVVAWVVAHAYAYHVNSVSFAGETWQPNPGRWTNTPGASVQVVTVG